LLEQRQTLRWVAVLPGASGFVCVNRGGII
jgi:hypothetical protein